MWAIGSCSCRQPCALNLKMEAQAGRPLLLTVGLVFVLLLTLILVLAPRSRQVRRGQRDEPWNLSQAPDRAGVKAARALGNYLRLRADTGEAAVL